MKKKTILMTISIIIVATVLAFVFLNQLGTSNEAKTQMLAKYELTDLSVKEMVNKLDSITDEIGRASCWERV